MSDTAKIKEIKYFSRFEHEIDEKRRVQIPADWRPEAGVEASYIMLRWWDQKQDMDVNHLRVFPRERFELIAGRIQSEISPSDEEAIEMSREIFGGAFAMSLDKAGRLCIPELLVNQIKLGKEVTLLGGFDHFEIWSKQTYENRRVDTPAARIKINQKFGELFHKTKALPS